MRLRGRMLVGRHHDVEKSPPTIFYVKLLTQKRRSPFRLLTLADQPLVGTCGETVEKVCTVSSHLRKKILENRNSNSNSYSSSSSNSYSNSYSKKGCSLHQLFLRWAIPGLFPLFSSFSILNSTVGR